MKYNANFGAFVDAHSVDEALALGLGLVKDVGVPVVSRGMATLEVPGPVMTVYRSPAQRVLFDPVRDANPFFHFFESLWILAGANTVEMPAFFLKRITDYSDDGKMFHGAYGRRLRHYGPQDPLLGGIDQIGGVIEMLKENPDTRQAVASIWNPHLDFRTKTKDMPCNDMLMFKIRDGRLNMTVCNRSNDVIWGAYGANAVQFSMIQEFVAAAVGVEMGVYTQISDSYHVYTDANSSKLWDKYVSGEWQPGGHVVNPYITGQVQAVPLFAKGMDWEEASRELRDLNYCFENGFANTLLTDMLLDTAPMWLRVAQRMLGAYTAYKAGHMRSAITWAQAIPAPDWRLACLQWLARRDKALGDQE